MAWQVIWCLARLGVFAWLSHEDGAEAHHHRVYVVALNEGTEIARFRDAVHLTGRKGRALASLVLSEHGSNFGDRLGRWAAAELLAHSRRNGISQSALGYRDQGKRISQGDLIKFLARIPGEAPPNLARVISPDIWWDRMVKTTSIADGEVFDRQVEPTHNFVANGIVVHNSLEQDADVVLFVFREQYYVEREEPRHRSEEDDTKFNDRYATWQGNLARVHGVAEVIVAKHRHGPTGTIKLHFDAPTTWFSNAAKEGSAAPDLSRFVPD